jgi:hypothetical protein
VEASGNAQVTIVGGTIRGTTTLADATGNARIDITGNVTASGRVREKGNAKVSAPPPAPEPVASSAAPEPTPPSAPAAPVQTVKAKPTTAKPATTAKPKPPAK